MSAKYPDCPQCGGSTRDAGRGNWLVRRVCEAEIRTDDEGQSVTVREKREATDRNND